MAINRIGNFNDTGMYATRNRYNSAQTLSDTQMYERMTAMITTAPSRQSQSASRIAQNSNPALTNGGQGIILNPSNRNSSPLMPQSYNTQRLMSARNGLADTNIAGASVVGNRNNIVNQYQHFMRQGAHDTAKHALNMTV
ncbi:MAG: hypothetical protein FWD98_01485 [Defluviitaleaceae bacterium]|nr:hypothetical protein [Defluviitaleaceae bacterium]